MKAITISASEWSEVAREALVESSLAGPALANHLRVEPELGTPARGGVPATRAVRVPSGWRLSPGASCTAPAATGWRGCGVGGTTGWEPGQELAGSFLVPADAAGVSIEESWDHLGMRATASHDVVLDGVLIPAEYAGALLPVGGQPPPSTRSSAPGWRWS